MKNPGPGVTYGPDAVLSPTAYRTVSQSFGETITQGYVGVQANAVAGEVNIILPPAASAKNMSYDVKKIDSSAGPVVVGADGLNIALTQQWSEILLISNGVIWSIVQGRLYIPFVLENKLDIDFVLDLSILG